MPAGDKYVEITRDDLEGWLRSNFGSDWSRDQRTAGVYLIHLSDSVAVKLISSIGRNDRNMGLGKASVKMMLSSRINPKITLNRKAKDRAFFQRTKNWKKSWLAGIRHWEGVYNKYPDFYDARGRGEEAPTAMQDQVSKPVKSEIMVQNPHTPDPEMLRKLRDLWRRAKGRNDDWTVQFTESIGKQYKDKPLSPKQKALVEKKLNYYKISRKVAARFLSGK